jgi:hypothetical protein
MPPVAPGMTPPGSGSLRGSHLAQVHQPVEPASSEVSVRLYETLWLCCETHAIVMSLTSHRLP